MSSAEETDDLFFGNTYLFDDAHRAIDDAADGAQGLISLSARLRLGIARDAAHTDVCASSLDFLQPT